MKTPAQKKAQNSWYARHKNDPEFIKKQRATKLRYYNKNKVREHDKALARYYKKRYDKGDIKLWYSEDVAKLFNLAKTEVQILGKLLGVPKEFGRYFFSRRYINMISWILRYREVS